jgi:hypothetical protein
MWEDLTAGMCVLGFTAAITVVLIELPAVLNWPPIVRRPMVRRTRIAALSGRRNGGLRSKFF